MALPPLITSEGLVLNNMMPDEGALGGYTPKGTASSEGVALMLRGIIRAAIATNDPVKVNFAKFLLDGAITHFFEGVRPTTTVGQGWHHSWICNGGTSFAVRGPLDPTGDLALGGYLYTRNPESTVEFVSGVGYLTPPPDVIYQVVSEDAAFVWNNMFADLTAGTSLDVEYYIDVAGNKVFGTQKDGSFGQPIIANSGETPGKIVLTTTHTGTLGVNYSVTVPEVEIAYGELYEAWPMWRKLGAEEVSTAGDAIHWFLEAFTLGMEMEPGNPDWVNARNRMLEVWTLACAQESNTTKIFESGTAGPYNNFPLTYSYAYGRSNVDDPETNWTAQAPILKYAAARTSDGYVSFTLPLENAATGSGGSVRYGLDFENAPLFLQYTLTSTITLDIKSSVSQIISVSFENLAGEAFEAQLAVAADSTPQTLNMVQFYRFQDEPGDATGIKTGDWSNEDPEYEIPEYDAVPFPGRIAALDGDSITWMCTFHNPAVGEPSPWPMGWGAAAPTTGVGYYEYYGHGMCGWFNYANQLAGQPLLLEPFLQERTATELPASRYKNGNNFALAGSRVTEWEQSQNDTLGDGKLEVGPVFNSRRYANKFNVIHFLGGTNDLGGGTVTAQTVYVKMRQYLYECAAAGKWVFVHTIPPRTREYIGGYYNVQLGQAAGTLERQDTVRARIHEFNEMLRDEFGYNTPGVYSSHKQANIWLVDHYAALLGPNGIDPAGLVSNDSNPIAKATHGNYKAGYEGKVFFYDGIHPGPAGAYIMGLEAAATMLGAGVPAAGSGPSEVLGVGPNLVANPNFTVTTTRQPGDYGKNAFLGRALGLGQALTDGSHPRWTGTGAIPADYDYETNLGLGYQYGQVPDNWLFYRSKNTFSDATQGEGWSNFNEYTWGDLAPTYPNVLTYMNDSTWANGSAVMSVITVEGGPALQIQFSTAMTGNKNEAFVLRTPVPAGQHGRLDNFGYAQFDWADWFANHSIPPTTAQVNTVPNTLYSPGDKLFAQAEVRMSNMVGAYTWRMALDFLSVDSVAVGGGDATTSGAPITSYAHSQNFWPPSLIDEVRLPLTVEPLLMRTPVVQAPAQAPNENQYYCRLGFEFAFDASTGPASGTIIIKNPMVKKVTGGTTGLK